MPGTSDPFDLPVFDRSAFSSTVPLSESTTVPRLLGGKLQIRPPKPKQKDVKPILMFEGIDPDCKQVMYFNGSRIPIPMLDALRPGGRLKRVEVRFDRKGDKEKAAKSVAGPSRTKLAVGEEEEEMEEEEEERTTVRKKPKTEKQRKEETEAKRVEEERKMLEEVEASIDRKRKKKPKTEKQRREEAEAKRKEEEKKRRASTGGQIEMQTERKRPKTEKLRREEAEARKTAEGKGKGKGKEK